VPPGAPVFTIPEFHAGLFTVQDEAESLVVPLLKPQPGERVLDLCAGPGGKLGHILEWSRGMAQAVGVDPARPRLAKVRDSLRRLGERAALVLADGRTFGRPGTFDRVLVDAPCSGLGVLRRRPDARWRKREEGLAEIVPLQAELLARGALLTAPHGVLVYSVCSFEAEETTGQIAAFLARHPDWDVERPGPGIVPAAGRWKRRNRKRVRRTKERGRSTYHANRGEGPGRSPRRSSDALRLYPGRSAAARLASQARAC
jgi:16S rRNA (cytosine967-C5)-methyltransferase